MSTSAKKRTRTAPATKRPAKRARSNFQQPRRKISQVEKKNFDATSTTTIVAAQSTATVLQIFTPDQGTAPTEHVGRRTNAVSLTYKWEGSFAPTTVGSSPLRMLIVYDKQPNAATPATTTIVVSDIIVTLMNLQNSRRFKVIADEIIPEFGVNGPASFMISGFRSINLETEYNDVNGGTIADITTGSMIALFWQNGNIITASPTNAFFSRVRFTDM